MRIPGRGLTLGAVIAPMKIAAAFHRRCRWINLPTASLIALLQRSPVAQVVRVADEMIQAAPAGAVLRSAAAAAAALGGLHSLAGATTLVSSPLVSPVSATVGSSISTTAITVNGTTSQPGSWAIAPESPTAAIPPGLAFSNSSGTSVSGSGAKNIDVPNGVLFLSGTPTAAGTYNLGLVAYEFGGETGINSPTYTFTIVVSASSSAPGFTTSPASATVNVGQSVTFTAAATGSPTYAWQKNGSPISGATSATYTIASPQLGDAGSYSVVATNGSGSTTSGAATLTVVSTSAAPVFTSQPLSQLQVDQGVTVNFNATAVGGTVSYQWEFGSGTPVTNGVDADGNTYSGAGTASLVVVANSSSSVYKVVASNGNGSTTSATATMTVASTGSTPVFTTQPLTQSATVGQTVTLTVAATNAATYQWYFGSGQVAGATSPTLTLPNVQTSATGTYYCIATSAGTSDIYGDTIPGNSTNSANATVTVTASAVPVFTTQPVAQTVNVGSTVTFTAAATGSPTYQWTFNGASITGNASATTATLTLSGVALSASGTYAVVATNAGGPVTSNSVTLSVLNVASPSFTLAASPAAATVATGRTAVFNAIATGTPAPTYQWTLNGSTSIPGASVTNDPILVITGATAADAGTINCTASNTIGTPATSSATLAVINTANPGYLTNLSGRGLVGSGAANALFGGFGISGTGTKQLLIRGMGPSLVPGYIFGIADALASTTLSLYNSSQVVLAQNAGWGGTPALMTADSQVGAYPPISTTSLDSILYLPVGTGSSSASVGGVGSSIGDAVIELYDADTPPLAAKLTNVSVRAPVGTGADILFGGFAIGGTTDETVLIRGIGPRLGLAPFNLSPVLAHPVLSLYLGATPTGYANTGWGGDAALASAMATVGAYPLDASSQDSLLLVTLPPGSYSAEVSGLNGATGIAVVEVYEIY